MEEHIDVCQCEGSDVRSRSGCVTMEISPMQGGRYE